MGAARGCGGLCSLGFSFFRSLLTSLLVSATAWARLKQPGWRISLFRPRANVNIAQPSSSLVPDTKLLCVEIWWKFKKAELVLYLLRNIGLEDRYATQCKQALKHIPT